MAFVHGIGQSKEREDGTGQRRKVEEGSYAVQFMASFKQENSQKSGKLCSQCTAGVGPSAKVKKETEQYWFG